MTRKGGEKAMPAPPPPNQQATSVAEDDFANAKNEYVVVSINGTLGPMGDALTPSLTSATPVTGAAASLPINADFVFPSVVLTISARPLAYVLPTQTGQKVVPNTIPQIGKNDLANSPKWIDASFTLSALDEQGNDHCSSDLQIVGILPQQTVSGTKTSVEADLATAVGSLATDLTSFFPAVNKQATGATSALGVLFDGLFPPKGVAFQYAYQDDNCHFGWFFQPNTTAGATTAEASLLGTQMGIALLKVTKRIRKIQVTGETLSEWNGKAVQIDKGQDLDIYYRKTTLSPFVLPDETAAYRALTTLSGFPALIPVARVMRILGFCAGKNDKDCLADSQVTTALATLKKAADPAKPPALTFLGPDDGFVTNASLSAYLGITSSPGKSGN
jgi:hypothetical protein